MEVERSQNHRHAFYLVLALGKVVSDELDALYANCMFPLPAAGKSS
jgi:hypothetical protein